jgi:hypothetical protein
MAMKIIMRFTGDQIQELLLANPLAQEINQRDLQGTQAQWWTTPDHRCLESHTEFDSDQAYLARDQAHPQRAPALAELIGQLSQLDCQFHCWTDLTAAVEPGQEPLSTYQRPLGLMRI